MVRFPMVAAAVLASLMVPSVAQAGKFSDRIHLLDQLRAVKRDQALELKIKFQSGDSHLTRDEYRARLAKLQAAVDRIAGKIDDIKERRASA